MALTDQQMMDVRRHAGYALTGTTMPITNDQDTVYMRFGMTVMSLQQRLTSLTAVEEGAIVSFLTTLAELEAAIPAAGENLDTERAAVWTRNVNEIRDRLGLFDMWRRRLCAFLGLSPGPGLGTGGMCLSRG